MYASTKEEGKREKNEGYFIRRNETRRKYTKVRTGKWQAVDIWITYGRDLCSAFQRLDALFHF
jgi:hypothetical protein